MIFELSAPILFPSFDVIIYLELAIFDIHRIYIAVFLTVIFIIFLMTSLAKCGYTSLQFEREPFHGNLMFSCPLVGCRFRSVRHVSAHVPSLRRYIRGKWGFLLFTSSSSPPPPPLPISASVSSHAQPSSAD
jgi:hypothetical protein